MSMRFHVGCEHPSYPEREWDLMSFSFLQTECKPRRPKQHPEKSRKSLIIKRLCIPICSALLSKFIKHVWFLEVCP